MKLLWLVLSCILSFLVNAQVINYDHFKQFRIPFSQHSFQGKVKTIISDYYSIKVDSSGKQSKKKINPSVTTGNIEFLKFDNSSRVVKEATIFKNNLDGNRTYKYYSSGDTVRMQEKYGSGKVVHDQLLFYNRKKNMLALHEIFPAFGLPEKQHLIFYNSKGEIDSVFVRTQKRDLGGYKFEYPNGKTIIRKEYRDSGRKGEVRTTTINDKGWVIKEVFQDEFLGTKYQIIYTYDQFGNPTNKKCSGGISFGSQNPDENGNLIYEFKYEYDDQNNWTKRKTYAHGKQISECNRTIKYF